MFFRHRFSKILTEGGHKVTCASDGRDVMKRLQESPDNIDLLILDLRMPHIDGFKVLMWMKKLGYNERISVLVVTGAYKAYDVVDRLKSLGVNGFITKDFTPEQIIYCLNRMLIPEETGLRTEPRFPICIPVYYIVDDKGYVGSLLNISASGLFLHTSMELRPRLMLRIKFLLPDSDRVFNVKGVVNWLTSVSSDSNMFDGAGVRFTSIADDEKEALRLFVEGEDKKLTSHLF